MSGVSRFKICTFELGGGAMNPNELDRVREALQAEAERLRAIAMRVEFGESASSGVVGVDRD